MFCWLTSLIDYMHIWHQISIITNEMNHFVRQIQAYSQLEVIECQWESLMDFTAKKEGDLDTLIEAHRTYLRHVVAKILWLHPKKEKEVFLFTRSWELVSNEYFFVHRRQIS